MSRYTINSYFDKVFVLSLRHETLARAAMSQKLAAVNIDFEFFEGVNGRSGEFSREWEFYEKRPCVTPLEMSYKKKFIESRGAWGYLKTMIKLLRYTMQRGYERILVFDNDVILARNFNARFEKFYQSVSPGWKILLLGASQYNWNITFKESDGYYHPIKLGTCGSFATAYHRSVIPQIIETARTMETPFDNLPLGIVYEKYKEECFVAYPNMAIADVRSSSIRGSRDLHAHSANMKWQLDQFEVPLG